jgi:NAD(P)-dependent dehydrogenase (short-subunit alcohol dehydrogenase family)
MKSPVKSPEKNPETQNPLEEMFGLKGTVAVITGGGGVLGRAIGGGLARAGAAVALTDLVEEKAEEGARAIAAAGGRAIGVKMDAFDASSIAACAERVEHELGAINLLINTAGGNMKGATVSPEMDFFHLPASAMEKVVGLNLFAGAVIPCQVLGERMVRHKKPANIINISSMTAMRPLTNVVGYSAAKAAISNFTQWLAVYMAHNLKAPVRVNAIAPGFFLTEQNRYLLTTDGNPEHLTPRGQTILAHTPMGQFGEPEDLIGAVIWLASPASRFVTGIVLPIDGGFSAFSGV